MSCSNFQFPMPVVMAAAFALAKTEPEFSAELMAAVTANLQKDWPNFLLVKYGASDLLESGCECDPDTLVAFSYLAHKYGIEKFAFVDPVAPADRDAIVFDGSGYPLLAKRSPAGIFDEYEIVFPARPAFGSADDEKFVERFAVQPSAILDMSEERPFVRISLPFAVRETTFYTPGECDIECTVKGIGKDARGKPKPFEIGTCTVRYENGNATEALVVPDEDFIMPFAAAIANKIPVIVTPGMGRNAKGNGIVFEMPGFDMQPVPVWLAAAGLFDPIGKSAKRITAPVTFPKDLACKMIDRLWWTACGRDYQAARLL